MKNILFILLGIVFFNGCFYIDEDFAREPNLTRKAGGTILALEWWYINPDITDSKSFGNSTADYGASAEKRKDNYIIKWISQFSGEKIPDSDLYKVNQSKKNWKKGLTKEEYIKRKQERFEFVIKSTLCIDDPVYIEFYTNNPKMAKPTIPFKGYWHISKKTREKFEKEIREEMKKEIKKDDWEDDPNQFYYEKDEKGNYIVYDYISDVIPYKEYVTVPIRECFSDGWCLTYKDRLGKDLFVKKEALYK